jgi:phospholipid/cholesterol/gamma-HCH transport system substrate-binding protein
MSIRPLISLAAFVAAGALSAVVVIQTLDVPVGGATTRYSAEFVGVEGLRDGNDVTLAGVRVGKVADVRSTTDGPTSIAAVSFSVRSDVHLPGNITAAIRYGDMLGARYLALETPADPSGTLAADEVIPLSRTSPPVDLTALVNGFEPLFDAIDPNQINSLARSIVDAFSGRSSAIESLLVRVASMTRGLTDNEQILDELIANLGSVTSDLDSRSADITRLIDGLAELGDVAVRHGDQLVSALEDGSDSMRSLAELLTHAGAPLDAVVADSTATTDAWTANTEPFDRTMTLLPELARSINRIGDYGGWLNLYTCNFTLLAGSSEANIFGTTHSEICR